MAMQQLGHAFIVEIVVLPGTMGYRKVGCNTPVQKHDSAEIEKMDVKYRSPGLIGEIFTTGIADLQLWW